MQFVAVALALLVLTFSKTEGQRVAGVRFDAKGITGYIKFYEVEDGVRIVASLQGLRGDHGWHVHHLPVDQTVDPAVQCLGDWVGPHYDPFNRNTDAGYADRCSMDPMNCEAGDLRGKFGPLRPGQLFNETDNTGTLFLSGQYSIIGRSVVIHRPGDNANFECGTIRSVTEMNGAAVSLLQSSFVFPVGGSIYFRQVEGEEVQIWGRLYWTTDSPTTVDHNWHIHQLAPGEEYRMGVCNTSTNILGHYRPLGNGPTSNDNYIMVCAPNMTQGCEVGDLTGKHSAITVQAETNPYGTGSFFFTDNFLNLTGVNPVVNRSVAVHEADGGGPVIACAPLVMSENLVLTQYKVAEITMSQASPFEDTVLTSSGGTRTETSIQRHAFNQLIQGCVSGDLFTPYDPVDVTGGTSTPDQYSMGALQQRYSEIGGITTQRLFDVPIYGAGVSITSLNLRAVGEEGSSCSGLMPSLTDVGTILAKASFSRVLRGAIYLIQKDFSYGQLGNTHIIVDLYYEDSSTSATMSHNWHVHDNGSPANTACVPIIGGHFNPFNVSLATPSSDPVAANSDYSDNCSPRYQLRCESGDVGSKHGRLNISPDGPNRPTYTYVDSNLQLAGFSTIIGRSIAIHDIISGTPIFDCSTIQQVYASDEFTIRTSSSNMLRTALTGRLAEEVDGLDPTDIIILNQNVRDIGFRVICVDVSMRVLASTTTQANSYASMLMARADDLFRCSGASQSASITQATFLLPLLLVAVSIMGFKY